MSTQLSSPRRMSSHDAYAQSEAKRRRLRKGTHSCWECKRRKMKCIFDPDINSVCKSCRRRGSQCLTQEVPEEVAFANTVPLQTQPPVFPHEGTTRYDSRYEGDHNCSRLEERLPTALSNEETVQGNHGAGIATPVSLTTEEPRSVSLTTPSTETTAEPEELRSISNLLTEQDKSARLSKLLYNSLPSREDIEKICTASRHLSVLSYEIMTVPYTTLEQRGLQTPESLMEIPGPNAHPVLIAKYMLLLASLLRHLHPDLHKKIKGLSESPRAVMERLADLAIGHVTTNDELLGSIEGLESVMIESVYHANVGSLRRSWLTGRRAMNIAQLMGINRLDHQAHYKVLDTRTKYDLPLMWFRIVFLDRYLCLMLGLSQGSLDRSMASDGFLASDTPMGRLERIHCVIASRILERNETQPSAEGLALTRTLDVELQKAARSLPSKWWLTPNLTAKPIDPQALFWSARRLSAQLLHYNLLNQLHLPYILRSSSSDRRYEYSLIACVNASREVLSRFIALRSFDGFAYNCRTVDFLALMAAMTLLLAHLDSNLSETDNLLAHQYHSDRAMIEKVQENMKEVNRLNSDTLSAKSANLLCKLLTIEVETADGYPHSAGVVSVQEVGGRATPSDQDDDAVVSVHIPYFGIIKIAREGISKAIPLSQDPAPLTGTSAFSPTTGGGVSTGRTDDTHRDSAYRTSALALSRSIEVPSSAILTPIDTSYGAASSAHSNPYSRSQGHGQIGVRLPPVNGINSAATHLTLQQNEEGLSHSILEHDIYPGLAAGVEDWAFQGVDLAFFESLMRSTAGLGGNAMGVGL